MDVTDSGAKEPVMVEKTRPDGYMILNGHHRWAAAYRVGLRKLKIKIVDLTTQRDIRKMLENATSDKRVTLDLDEVVFRPATDPYLEQSLRLTKERRPDLYKAFISHRNDKNEDGTKRFSKAERQVIDKVEEE